MNYVLVSLLALTFCFYSITSQGNLPSGCQDAFRKVAITAHNNFRVKHGAPADYTYGI